MSSPQRQAGTVCSVLLLLAHVLVAWQAMHVVALQDVISLDESPGHLYIVQLKAPSVAVHLSGASSSTYGAATAASTGSSPSHGPTVSLASAAAIEHASLITTQAHTVASSVFGAEAMAKVRTVYRYAYAGFAAGPLSQHEVSALQADPAVARVSPAKILQVQTITSPTFLGLTAPEGTWSQLGGPTAAGEDVVIGVLDTGIWSESPLFSDSGYGPVPSHFKGSCSGGPGFPETACNNKVVGCKFFTAGFDGFNLTEMVPYEYESCRDAFSHGSHTSATSAGNWGVASPFAALPGNMSGMAPRARISVYKVCWGKHAGNFCNEVDILAGIEAATLDQVDIINYSMGGSYQHEKLSDSAISMAMHGAAASGVFIAAAAGNTGPDTGSVDNISPWITTVGASTHNRAGRRVVQLGNGVTFTGSGLPTPAPRAEVAASKPVPLVLAEAAVRPGISPEISKLCLDDTLDPAKVAGRIVVCESGSNERWEKSRNVKAARGVGMVLLNTVPDATMNDLHYVPTVHLSHTFRDAVRAYAASAGATAMLPAALVLSGEEVQAPEVAEFSGRGPSHIAGGWILKPDITAPGVDILSAASPPGSDGRLFDLLSGTSMSSPCIAGIAALIKQKHPGWSPMMIKSALMTTAYQSLSTGAASGQPLLSLTDPFAVGSGHVNPTAALNPGLVLDSGVEDWNNFLCGRKEIPVSEWPTTCPACLTSLDTACHPANLNLPSISLPGFVGLQTVQRRLTSVLGEVATFSVATEDAAGFTVSSAPETFSLAPGETQVVNISVTYVQGTAFNSWGTLGAVSWTSSLGTVTRLPIVARAEQHAIPRSVSFNRGSRSQQARLTYQVRTAYTGVLRAHAVGMRASHVFTGTVKADDHTFFDPGHVGAAAVEVDIPAAPSEGWNFARFAMFDDDLASDNDLDLYIYKDGKRIASAAEPDTSRAEVNLRHASGKYTAYIHGFNVPAGQTQFKLHLFLLRMTPQAAGNGSLQASVGSVPTTSSSVAGVPLPVILELDTDRQHVRPNKRYMGLVTYSQQASHDSNEQTLDIVTSVYLKT